MKKEVSGAALVLAVLFVLTFALGVAGYTMNKNNKQNNQTPTPTPTDVTPSDTDVVPGDTDVVPGDSDVVPADDTTPAPTVDVVGDYGFKRVADGHESIDELHLRSDGTFYLSVNNYNANQPYVGNYTVNGNSIVLQTTVVYGSDACFYTNNTKYEATLNNDTITLNYNLGESSETITFTKGVAEPEIEKNLKYWVTNPVNGVTPEGFEQAWVDCTNLTNK